ncbi:Cytoskeleton protein RodZ [Neomoorella glycerini]|uniref:Cytoskeleton protein RodZ n=1 Tax=Neomoorella glycerini TaxID=55779 RepID=A0A6I5ZLP1_9FIRM|nr:helix-turn-helix domain-containing protein [Moorella glycerini]QGP90726.1 Cytoskeleton protein RodZ [Moorella glycerini]
MTVGERLKKLREERGISLEELADRLDIAPDCMAEVEKGTRRLSTATLAEVAGILNVDISYFTEENGNKDQNTVGARLRRLREQKGITLSELSRRSGVSLAHISEIERSRSTASLKTLEKLAAVLEVSPSSLLRSSQEDTLGNKLKRLREKMGLTQKELAQQVGISHSLIGQIETDRIQPSLATLSSLAEALGVSTCYFLMEEEEEDLYLDYRLAADIREALRRPVLQQIVRALADWEEMEIRGLLDFLHSLNENRRPLSVAAEDQYQEIRRFVSRAKEEERNLVLNLIRLLQGNTREEEV